MLRPFRGVLPRVHPTAFIDDSAQVIGDVEIGEESSIWMNVVMRGDVHRIRLGRRSNVQDGTVVHVVVDPKSLLYLNGTTLEWEQTLMRQGFKFANPNEKSGCGCGHSFSV